MNNTTRNWRTPAFVKPICRRRWRRFSIALACVVALHFISCGEKQDDRKPAETPDPNASHEQAPPSFSFSVKSHRTGSSIVRIDCNGGKPTLFNGSYDRKKCPADVSIFPIVYSPDDRYYPNKSIVLLPDGLWNAHVYIGSDRNPPGESFIIYFVAVRRILAYRLKEIEETHGIRSLSELPEDGTILTSVTVTMTVPCGKK
jgi:hypothetical protein